MLQYYHQNCSVYSYNLKQKFSRTMLYNLMHHSYIVYFYIHQNIQQTYNFTLLAYFHILSYQFARCCSVCL